MRCKGCGAELILSKVTADDMVRGLEHQTFVCSGCYVTEHQLLLMRHRREDDTPMSVDAPPYAVPGLTVQAERATAPGLFSRTFAHMRGQ
jgi:hypothetical protein